MALFCSALSRKIELNCSSVSDATYISFETVARRNREQGMLCLVVKKRYAEYSYWSLKIPIIPCTPRSYLEG